MKGKTKNDYLINKQNSDKTSEKDEFIFEKHSDIIIRFIVNKIIIKALNEIKDREINEKMNALCCDYVLKNLNNVLKTQFFDYENDLDDEKNSFDLDSDKESILVLEPDPPEKDRNNSNMIKINDFKDLSTINEIFETIESKKNSLTETEKYLEKKKEKVNLKKIQKNKELIDNENSSNSLNKDLIISLPFTDLEKNKYTNKYIEQNKSREYNILRKERELEIKRKEEEKASKKKKVIKKVVKEKKFIFKKLNLKKIKKEPALNINDLLFDSDGNIIERKLIPIDSLVKDFSFAQIIENDNKKIKSGIKTLKHEANNNKNKKKIIPLKKEKEKFKTIANEIEKTKIKDKEPITERSNISQKIEYNPRDKEDIYQNIRYRIFIEENRADFFNNSFNDNIIPETGVVLKTDLLYKKGGKDFFNKYNRLSIKEFKNYIKNFSQNSTESTNINNCLNSNEIKKDNNETAFKYNGYAQKFEENNPLIKGANKMDKKLNLKFKKISPNKKRFLSNYKIHTPKWRINNFSDSLILSNDKHCLSNDNFDNLYNYLSERDVSSNHNFDSTKESNDIKFSFHNKMNSSHDLLKNIIKRKFKLKKTIFPIINNTNEEKNHYNNELINSMEKFNQKIINDVKFNNWGNSFENIRDKDLNKFSFYRKLNKYKLDNKRERKKSWRYNEKEN